MRYQEDVRFPQKKCSGCVFFDEYEERKDSRCSLIEWALRPECRFSFDQIASVMRCNKEKP